MVPTGLVACLKCGSHTGTPGAGGSAMRKAKLVPLGQVTTTGSERVSIGGGWDRSIGGTKGVPLQKTIIITGAPGSGKSTILQHRMDDYLRVRPDRFGYYLSAEQSPSDVRKTFEAVLQGIPDRIRDRLFVPDAMDGGMQLDPEMLREHPPIFVVVDSVSEACGKDLDAVVAMTRYFKTKIAVPYNCIVALVFHMNKGEDVAGKLAAIHFADTLAAMEGWNRGDPAHLNHPDNRCLSTYKNRGDPSHVQSWFHMTGKDEMGQPDGSYRGLEEIPEKVSQPTKRNPGLPRSVLELAEMEEDFRADMAERREEIVEARKHVLSLAAKPEKAETPAKAKRPAPVATKRKPRRDDAGA